MSELRDLERRILGEHPDAARVHEHALRDARDQVNALIDRFDAEVTRDASDANLAAFNEELATLQRRVLKAYAEAVAGMFAPAVVEQWASRLGPLPLDGPHGMVAEAGVPGGVLLADALEAVPDSPTTDGSLDAELASRVRACLCGFAATRVVPGELCGACSVSVLEAWLAEERRLWGLAPQHPELDRIIGVALDKIARLRSDPTDGIGGVERAAVRRAGRRIARVNRTARAQGGMSDMTHWESLAALATLDCRPITRSVAKRWRRRGLGAARLTAAIQVGSAEVAERLAQQYGLSRG